MSDKYYRDINTNKDIVKFKLQLGAILLKLNEHNSNFSNINNDITKINTDIENNDNDVKSNYDICIANKNSLIDMNRKSYTLDNSVKNIDNKIKNIKGAKYNINNIWIKEIDLEKELSNNSFSVSYNILKYKIEDDFNENDILEIKLNILYDYSDYNAIGKMNHMINLSKIIDNNIPKMIDSYISVICNAGDNENNFVEESNLFYIKLKDNHKNMNIHFDLIKRVVSSNSSFKFKRINPYKTNKIIIINI